MEQRKIRIFHIIQDDKFLDGVMNAFESEIRYDNHYFYFCKSKNHEFKWIKNVEKIKLIYTPQIAKKILGRSDYDVVFFCSMLDYQAFKYIPENKIVIWWAWGYDLYGKDRFINVPLYKFLTKIYVNRKNLKILPVIKSILRMIPIWRTWRLGSKDNAIRRIDYFQPVIRTEYQLLKKTEGFHAKEFYYPGANSFKSYLIPNIPKHCNRLIIGNSATPTNNHCDVWQDINSYIPDTVNVVVPISYGDKEYGRYIVDVIGKDNPKVDFLTDVLPYNEYMNLLDSCSYAVYGVLRQQAMGAIFRCVASGIKLFLYRDSLVYEYLKKIGCFFRYRAYAFGVMRMPFPALTICSQNSDKRFGVDTCPKSKTSPAFCMGRLM